MSRTVLIVALLGVAACQNDKPASDEPGDTAFADTNVHDSAIETGLWVDTDTDIWLDTGPETDVHTDVAHTDVPCVLPGFVIDCDGQCSSQTLVGDGFCDDGPKPRANFDCEDFGRDGGDCILDTSKDTDPCPNPGEVPDCNGNCFAGFLVGDGDCQDGPAPGADFSCGRFADDGGDCLPHTDVDTQVAADTAIDTDAIAVPCAEPLQVRDCTATCWPEAWLGDARCDDGTAHRWGNPDFDCAYFGHDRGDCPDTDLPVDTSTSPVDTGPAVDTFVTDTDVPMDTLVSDTGVSVDTLVSDTLVPVDTLVSDTLVTDTLVTDTLVTDTLVSDTLVVP